MDSLEYEHLQSQARSLRAQKAATMQRVLEKNGIGCSDFPDTDSLYWCVIAACERLTALGCSLDDWFAWGQVWPTVRQEPNRDPNGVNLKDLFQSLSEVSNGTKRT
jgi:hypothetical protein